MAFEIIKAPGIKQCFVKAGRAFLTLLYALLYSLLYDLLFCLVSNSLPMVSSILCSFGNVLTDQMLSSQTSSLLTIATSVSIALTRGSSFTFPLHTYLSRWRSL